jgi:hypothetical protein
MAKNDPDLEVLEVAALMKRKPPQRHRVSANLYLQVRVPEHKPTKSRLVKGRAAWLFRYMNNGRPHWMGLGSYYDFTLAEARQRARVARQQLTDDIDPLAAKREKRTAARLAAAKSLTFGECARRYVATHAPSWKNPKHAQQWRAVFEGSPRATAATAAMNELPVGSIDTNHVVDCLRPIWLRTPETASRVRQRIEAVLDWAKALGYRQGENPARLKGHLKNLLPKAAVEGDARQTSSGVALQGPSPVHG